METLDKLYLELSLISKAETAKDLAAKRQIELYERILNRIAYDRMTVAEMKSAAFDTLSVFGGQHAQSR